MKHEPVDHLGRPRKSSGGALKLLLRVVVGLGLGVGSACLGLWLTLPSMMNEPSYVMVPPVGMLVLLGVALVALEWQGVTTGYVVVVGSYAAGLASVLLVYGVLQGRFF